LYELLPHYQRLTIHWCGRKKLRRTVQMLDFTKMNTPIIGIDTQCVSFLIDAIQNVKEPTDSLSTEKIALFRIYLYTQGTLCVTPTVTKECAAIRNVERKELHESYIEILIEETQIQDQFYIESRVTELKTYHNGIYDCCILAEAEEAKFIDVLLSYDNKFLSRLKMVSSRVKLCRPSEYWSQLNISHGAKPDKLPHDSNPLSQQSWWKW